MWNVKAIALKALRKRTRDPLSVVHGLLNEHGHIITASLHTFFGEKYRLRAEFTLCSVRNGLFLRDKLNYVLGQVGWCIESVDWTQSQLCYEQMHGWNGRPTHHNPYYIYHLCLILTPCLF